MNYIKKYIDYLASSGVHGFFVNGINGEGAWLSQKEKITVFKTARDIKKQNQFLCVACIQSSTNLVLQEIDVFASLKPNFIVVATPYYKASQSEILYHLKKIVDYSSFPVLIYNIPQDTNNNIELTTILELFKINKYNRNKG